MSFSDSMLRIGVPSKGRLSELATELLLQAGLNFRRQERALFARVSGLSADITFLRTDDIPTLCAEGAIDLGITGSDLVAEAQAAVDVRMKLGVGRCKLAVCVPLHGKIQSASDLDGKRVATSFPRTTERYLDKHSAKVHLVGLNGSVEIMISLGVADAIADVVSTGTTLKQAGLAIIGEPILESEAVLIGAKEPTEEAANLIRRLTGVIIERQYVLMDYDIKTELIDTACAITPGFESPTISPLRVDGWSAVRAMVPRKSAQKVMDELWSIGARGILVTDIHACRL